MVVFNIVEQDTQKKEEYEYEKLIELYNKGLTTTEIQKEIGLTKYKYSKHRQEALKEGRIKARQDTAEPKYYHRIKNGNYVITKRNSETMKMESYGTYHSLEEVEKKVEELKRNNWDRELCG